MIETILITAVSVAWFFAGYCAGKWKSTKEYLRGYDEGFETSKRHLKLYFAGRKDGYMALDEALKEEQDD